MAAAHRQRRHEEGSMLTCPARQNGPQTQQCQIDEPCAVGGLREGPGSGPIGSGRDRLQARVGEDALAMAALATRGMERTAPLSCMEATRTAGWRHSGRRPVSPVFAVKFAALRRVETIA